MHTGILPVDKPQGWTSHDVVARVRRLAGQREVGHAGTLDPLATGLLLLVLGKATRLSRYLMASTKSYCAEVVLGASTNTDDAEGTIHAHGDIAAVSRDAIQSVLPSFTGAIRQVPPAYAAVRQGGERLYALARKGIEVRPEPRSVTIHELRLLGWEPPRLRLFLRCGSGTYVRSLARDIGVALGTFGYLHALRRVESAGFRVEDSFTLAELESGGIQSRLVRSDRAVVGLPAAVVVGEDIRRVRNGGAVRLGADLSEDSLWVSPILVSESSVEEAAIRLYDPSGNLLALAAVDAGTARPFLVFPADM
jgi:tRNA pseudouridine55 synthase